MSLTDDVRSGLIYMDGGMGTLLQNMGLKTSELPETWNISHPDRISSVHEAYFAAGSNIVLTNTFGANSLKYTQTSGEFTLENVIRAGVDCALKARKREESKHLSDNISISKKHRGKYIGLDIGPLGKLLKPFGDLDFEDAVRFFSRTAKSGADAGADFIMIETMNDAYETKAAVLAAKESCDLPVWVSNVYDETGKLMTGATPEAMAATLEGLGVDALGLNCSLGPDKMLPIVKRLYEAISIPLIVKPNAGLPHIEDGHTAYDVDAVKFCEAMKEIVTAGARIVGGCCGTTPEYISMLVRETENQKIRPVIQRDNAVVSSYTQATEFGDLPILIGERINPTGKKKMKEALKDHDYDFILKEALRQEEKGVDILDVNVGLPDIDEPAVLSECIKKIQAVTSLPLQIDTSNTEAMERALRIYNGKALINSVNGKKESMDAVFPIAKKYGGLTVCLTLDEEGIPKSAQGRLRIAEKITKRAAEYGISPRELIFDPLAMTVSADSSAAKVTLDSISLIKKKLNAKCSLGISNISFGLPERDSLTSVFWALALSRGLDAAILNPYSKEIINTMFSYRALMGFDQNCMDYIEYAKKHAEAEKTTIRDEAFTLSKADFQSRNMPETDTERSDPPKASDSLSGLRNSIIHGLAGQAGDEAERLLKTSSPIEVIDREIIPALDVVGVGYEKKTMFLPQLLMSAEAASAAFEKVKKLIPPGKDKGPKIVLATVKGDIHDIGKNIVKVLLENYGFNVIDLGRDVDPEIIKDVVEKNDIRLTGLSALMTTTVVSMEESIKLLKKYAPECKVAVGGAVMTKEYADMIGADRYCKTAMDTVRYAEEVFSV